MKKNKNQIQEQNQEDKQKQYQESYAGMFKQVTYTTDELAELLHTHRDTITALRESGILKAIKLGKYYLFSCMSIMKFLETYEGYDLSNSYKMSLAYEEVTGNNDF